MTDITERSIAMKNIMEFSTTTKSIMECATVMTNITKLLNDVHYGLKAQVEGHLGIFVQPEWPK